MTVDNKKAKRKPGGGRKPSKPNYNPSAILQNQIEQAVALYRTEEHPSLQTIKEPETNSGKLHQHYAAEVLPTGGKLARPDL